MKKQALVIGVNAYEDLSGLTPLQFAEADARDLAAVLRGAYGFSVTSLLGSEATRDAIENALTAAGEGDLFLFFFAGHGQLIRGQYRLHPVNSDAKGNRTLPLSDLSDLWQNDFGYHKVLTIIDACRNEGRSLRGNRGLDVESSRAIYNLTQGERWLEVVYGCREGQVSYEVDELGHGIFTNALLEVLRRKHASLTSDTLAGAAADWMREWCRQDSKGRVQEATRYHRPSLTEKIELLSSRGLDIGPPETRTMTVGQPPAVSRLGVLCWETNRWRVYPLEKLEVERRDDSLNILNMTYIHGWAKVFWREEFAGDFEAEIELAGDFWLEVVAADGQDRSMYIRPAEQGVDASQRQKYVILRRGGAYEFYVGSGKRLHYDNWCADDQMPCYVAVALSNAKAIRLFGWNARSL